MPFVLCEQFAGTIQEPIRRDAVLAALGRRVLKVREVKRNDAARPYERFLHAHTAHPTHTATTAHAATG